MAVPSEKTSSGGKLGQVETVLRRIGDLAVTLLRSVLGVAVGSCGGLVGSGWELVAGDRIMVRDVGIVCISSQRAD